MAQTILYNTLNSAIATVNSSIDTQRRRIDSTNSNVTTLTTDVGNIKSTINDIGTIKAASSTKSVNPSNKTITIDCSVTLEPGTWVIYGQAVFPSSVASSRQGVTITTANTSNTYNALAYNLQYQSAASSANQYYNVTLIQKVSTQSTYYLMVFSGNHGSTIQVTGYMRAVRIA